MVEAPVNSAPSFRERRSVPRFNLTAAAEVIEPRSGVRISGRISEISRNGCFLDILNPLPVGTRLRLTISRDQGTFSTDAKIIYLQAGMGAGILFLDVAPDQSKVLDAWLEELQR